MYLKNGEEQYQISVIGDFDSDGRIKQVEITKLIRHVVGLKEYQLTGVYLKSADLNNNCKTKYCKSRTFRIYYNRISNYKCRTKINSRGS